MKREEELMKQITAMMVDTSKGKLSWKVSVSTTEYNSKDKKPVVEDDGKLWTVDECYVLYETEYKGKEFLLISYEMIHTSEDEKKTTNLIFIPPSGNRFFDVNSLLPHSVEASQILVYQVHQLWLMLLELNKENSDLVTIDANERELTIE